MNLTVCVCQETLKRKHLLWNIPALPLLPGYALHASEPLDYFIMDSYLCCATLNLQFISQVLLKSLDQLWSEVFKKLDLTSDDRLLTPVVLLFRMYSFFFYLLISASAATLIKLSGDLTD